MLSFFRRVSKSKIGTGVMAAILIAILAGFAAADLSNFGSGQIGLGMSTGTLAKVGDQEIRPFASSGPRPIMRASSAIFPRSSRR